MWFKGNEYANIHENNRGNNWVIYFYKVIGNIEKTNGIKSFKTEANAIRHLEKNGFVFKEVY